MSTKRFYLLLLLIPILFFISCNKSKKSENHSLQPNSVIKIGSYQWFFNNQGLNKALKKAKEKNKLIFAVFSSKW